MFEENCKEQQGQQHDIRPDNRETPSKRDVFSRPVAAKGRRACTHTQTLGGRQDTACQHGQGTAFFTDNDNYSMPRDGAEEDLVALMKYMTPLSSIFGLCNQEKGKTTQSAQWESEKSGARRSAWRAIVAGERVFVALACLCFVPNSEE